MAAISITVPLATSGGALKRPIASQEMMATAPTSSSALASAARIEAERMR